MDSLIGHCAVSSNNLNPRFVKLSAIDVIAQAILESLYLVSGLSEFAPRGNVPMYPDPHRNMAGYFSILVPFFRSDEGTGTRPDYLVNRDDQKNEGPFGGKSCMEIEK